MTNQQRLSPSTDQKEQNAFRFSLAMAVSMTVVAAILLVTGGLPKGWFDLTALVMLTAAASWVSTWLSRQHQSALGIILMLASLSFAYVTTAIQYSGFGAVLAMVALIFSFGAGSAALPRKHAALVNTVSIVMAMAFILLDVFEPFQREPNNLPTLTWSIAGVLAAIFGIGILRNFNEYNFRTKLIISFIFMSILTVGILTIFNQNTTNNILTENLGRELKGEARTRGSRIGDLINEQVNTLTVLAQNEIVEDSAIASNDAYIGREDSFLAEIEQLDQQWRAADAADNNDDPLVYEMLNNAVSKELGEFQEAFPSHVEVFTTDRYGALNGTTNRTSDYYQADEDWWQAAYNNGIGYIYISDPEFDESAGEFSILIAIPIYAENTGELSGILRTTFLMSALTEILAEPIGETGEADLYLPGISPLHIHNGVLEPIELDFYDQLRGVSAEPYAEMLYDDVESVVSQAPVRTFGGGSVVDNLDWFVAVHQSSEEVFGPIQAQTRASLGLVIVIVGVAAGIAVGLAQILVSPISRLTATAQEIAAGELSIQAQITTQDEVGVLAKAFNEMTAQLRNLLAGLEERVAARTRDLELAAEVGQRLSLVSETEAMLTSAVQIIQERFDLYYTQVYLTDPTGRSLVLRAGTGDVGQTLLRRGHRLPTDMGSLNGIAATERRTVVVADTTSSTIHRPNPLLPDTRSEMAVPLLVGGRVVGVLDMQSTQPGALNPENQVAFEALAGSLAIAIANAELFEQAEAARTTVEEQARRLASSGWQDFLDAIERRERLAFTYNQQNLTPLSEPLPSAQDGSLTTPIEVAGAAIGKLHFERERQWSEDDHAIVQSVSRQVAQQIENMRLLAQAEQYQAEAQAALRRLTREGWEQFQEQLGEKQIGFLYDDYQIKPLEETDLATEKALSYPISIQNETIGHLDVLGIEELSEEDAELVANINEQLSAHLESLRLSQQTQAALSQSETLYEIGRQLNQATNEEEILASLNSTAVRIGCTQTSLMYIDQDSSGKPEWLRIVAAWSQYGGQESPIGNRFSSVTFPLMSAILGKPDQPMLISNIANAEHIDAALKHRWISNGFQAICIIPLGQAGQWQGLLTLGWDKPHVFSNQEKTIFDSLVSLLTPVVQSQRLFGQVQIRAQREQALRQITAAVRSSSDPATIMRTAVKELGAALGRKTVIRLAQSEQTSDKELGNS